jgi:phage host-nuclease inhibitor protein Gam
MSTNRIKLPNTIITRARAEEILGELAVLKLEEREQKNELDRELTAARESREAPLLKLTKKIEEKTALLESWASANPGEFPKNRKSIELIHGVIGYRTGTPKLKTLPKWTWDRVLEKLKEMLPEMVRSKEEVNKEGIIAAVGEGRLEPESARQLGVTVVQDETFFVEPRIAEQPARSMSAAA